MVKVRVRVEVRVGVEGTGEDVRWQTLPGLPSVAQPPPPPKAPDDALRSYSPLWL